MSNARAFRSFEDFYQFYLDEHRNRTSRRLHVVGAGLVLATVAAGLFGRRHRLLLPAPVLGYGFAWIGHYVFEKNRPATFSHPLWSLRGDFRMFFEIVSGRRPF